MTINTRVFPSTRRLLLLTPVFVSTDHQETATSDKFPSVRETAKQVQAAPEEEEDEEDEEEDEDEEEEDGDKIKKTTEEKSRGSN